MHSSDKRQVLLLIWVGQSGPIIRTRHAVPLYLVVCIFLVFGALMEYAVILLLLKKRRKPKYTIDSGLKKMFSNNGDVTAQAPGAAAAVAAPSAATPQQGQQSGSQEHQIEFKVGLQYMLHSYFRRAKRCLLKLPFSFLPF